MRDDRRPVSKSETSIDEESEALDSAFQISPTDPHAQIKALEDFLARYPNSTRREQVLRAIYRRAFEANDSRKAADAIARLVELRPEDVDLLSAAASLYEHMDDPASRQKAIEYGTRFVNLAESMTLASRPRDVSEEKWPEFHQILQATAYAMRGKSYARVGENERAIADLAKSLAAYPTAQVAEQLGDAALKAGDTDRAVSAFATAFAIPDKRIEPAQRDQVRKKLGSAYVARYKTEKGLGDLVLARYDELARTLGPRFKDVKQASEVNDAMQVQLERLDGSKLKLADLRGKIIVLEFWATWCPPCRIEGELLEKVVEDFRSEPRIAFLTVNTDEDRSTVPSFLKEAKWSAPAVYAQGLDQLMSIRALPTLIMLDGKGRVIFRQTGLDFGSFVETVESRLHQELSKTQAASP